MISTRVSYSVPFSPRFKGLEQPENNAGSLRSESVQPATSEPEVTKAAESPNQPQKTLKQKLLGGLLTGAEGVRDCFLLTDNLIALYQLKGAFYTPSDVICDKPIDLEGQSPAFRRNLERAKVAQLKALFLINGMTVRTPLSVFSKLKVLSDLARICRYQGNEEEAKQYEGQRANTMKGLKSLPGRMLSSLKPSNLKKSSLELYDALFRSSGSASQDAKAPNENKETPSK